MENWEFLLQRKGDKSWLPLESPTVEIVEGQYRLAARSDLTNVPVGIAIAYRPLAEVRHQPLQQQIVKRLSHDGLLIVMPYTNFVPGLWQIDCLSVTPNAPTEAPLEAETANDIAPWKKTVKFDVIAISSDFGSEWQYSDPEEELESPVELATDLPTNALGIEQTEPTPLTYSSPILDIAEQRSTELVQSMFEEFALFNDESDELEDEDAASNGDIQEEDLGDVDLFAADEQSSGQNEAPLQPRILLRLRQPQCIVDEDNSFNLVGDAYTKGEIEVILKDPQTLEVIVNERYPITNLRDRNGATGAIPFAHRIIVPPPSQIQVLIGEVQIHPQKDFQQYDDLFILQQAIAVSYPASRVLPEMLKEEQRYQHKEPMAEANLSVEEAIASSSYPQSPQSFPQAIPVTENLITEPFAQAKTLQPLSLPPLPSNKPKALQVEPEEIKKPSISLSLPPLPPPIKKTRERGFNSEYPSRSEEFSPSFPQAELDELQKIEAEFAQTDFLEPTNSESVSESVRFSTATNEPIQEVKEDEPELFYSFEEELPHNYEELLERPLLEDAVENSIEASVQNPVAKHEGENILPPLPSFPATDPNYRGRNNRFLHKLQTLSADAIAAQKASQRQEELLLDNFVPSSPLSDSVSPEDLSALSIDVDYPEQPLTIAEEHSLAELDRELDLELDRLLSPDLLDIPDHILNEYVWEDPVDPNSFPVGESGNVHGSPLSETAQTIRNIQEASLQSLSEQEAVPVPELLVASGEIISGTPMIVTVRLPAIAPKLFVKFWIKDLQTRTIIDGPRWLLDFSLVPSTELIETRTSISIPLSSIDVAFEAIAIEAQTQRESHKVRVTRAVTPPNLVQDRYE